MYNITKSFMTTLSTDCCFETCRQSIISVTARRYLSSKNGVLADLHSLVHFLVAIYLTTWEHIPVPEIPTAKKKEKRHCRNLNKKERERIGALREDPQQLINLILQYVLLAFLQVLCQTENYCQILQNYLSFVQYI